jgi:hypothetical protein
VQQADQAASKGDDKDGVDPKQHIAEEKAGKQAAGGKAGTGTQAAAPAPLHMPWKPLLAASEVQRGIGYYGSGGRLEAVVAKLLRGEPITAYALGGSVTKGSGASSEDTAYPGRFFEFIRKTFPHKSDSLLWDAARLHQCTCLLVGWLIAVLHVTDAPAWWGRHSVRLVKH